jgi:hypothetical protein
MSGREDAFKDEIKIENTHKIFFILFIEILLLFISLIT